MIEAGVIEEVVALLAELPKVRRDQALAELEIAASSCATDEYVRRRSAEGWMARFFGHTRIPVNDSRRYAQQPETD